jgi:hypothetical protein
MTLLGATWVSETALCNRRRRVEFVTSFEHLMEMYAGTSCRVGLVVVATKLRGSVSR